ncbi:HD domain-containing protein [Iodobacter sp. CM08]|uniref:HD domain-containing protein n=1 Tax=Iodobacter sp. CM08 TaxID=3085902 RepID=UPI0029822280|nr:HD domain-containing protein [Iodobacter sp. CM08]MDW5416252.1 HD domain-containing protein [Iodobacter sp. CM08]
MQLSEWETQFENKMATIATSDDPAHDLLHFKRVVQLAKKIGKEENAQLEVIIPAAWLHDFVIVPKDSPLRSRASKLSAEGAIEFLSLIQYPAEFYPAIAHAIEGHSFSANIEVTTLEAQIVQDADRLDGLGAIGIARCFATAGLLKRAFYADHDPFCAIRAPDDAQFTIDHFYKKLFKTAETLKTKAGKAEGLRRIEIMKNYLAALETEIL